MSVSVQHEAPRDLARKNPYLVVPLLKEQGLKIPDDVVASLVDTSLGSCDPKELRSDTTILLQGSNGSLVVVLESQSKAPDRQKQRHWACYVTNASAEHECDAVLVVIARSRRTARRCADAICTGHPGFDLSPIVIGPDSTPDPASPEYAGNCELAVLAALTRAIDLHDPGNLRSLLDRLAVLDGDKQYAYVSYIYAAVPPAARLVLEDIMANSPSEMGLLYDRLVTKGLAEGHDKGLAEGLAKGEARLLLRALAKRGFTVTDRVRERVMACADTAQLEQWFDRAMSADNIDAIFS